MATVATNPDGSIRERTDQLARAAFQWATPISSDAEKGGPNQRFGAGSQPLTGQAAQWQTPRVSTGAVTRDRGDPNAERLTLEGEARLWQTPAPADVMGGRTSRSGDRKDEVFLNGQASECSRQAREISTDGETSSRMLRTLLRHYRDLMLPKSPDFARLLKWARRLRRRALNANFVEWLMLWPPGWTLIASTGCGCSATAFTRYRRLMRSALSALGSPPEPAPAQASLF